MAMSTLKPTRLSNSALVVENIGNKKWRMHYPLQYFSVKFQRIIIVPEGTETDFASVPRLFWSIFPPDGKYTKAAVVHDFLCDPKNRAMYKFRSRAEVDFILYEAMLSIGVPKRNALAIYWAVSLYRIAMRID